MNEIMKTNEVSGFMKLNLRDVLRGLALSAGIGALTIVTSIDDVRDFADVQLWWDVLNSTWKAITAYLVMNLLSKK